MQQQGRHACAPARRKLTGDEGGGDIVARRALPCSDSSDSDLPACALARRERGGEAAGEGAQNGENETRQDDADGTGAQGFRRLLSVLRPPPVRREDHRAAVASRPDDVREPRHEQARALQAAAARLGSVSRGLLHRAPQDKRPEARSRGGSGFGISAGHGRSTLRIQGSVGVPTVSPLVAPLVDPLVSVPVPAGVQPLPR